MRFQNRKYRFKLPHAPVFCQDDLQTVDLQTVDLQTGENIVMFVMMIVYCFIYKIKRNIRANTLGNGKQDKQDSYVPY
ncbi:MAG: hypothetical protein DRH26_05780 [Deltaproteobacteria bacterium]|nr:MAG: hypothetical protein DRH26_05780 [Deltaproteobacteria bacterium]